MYPRKIQNSSKTENQTLASLTERKKDIIANKIKSAIITKHSKFLQNNQSYTNKRLYDDVRKSLNNTNLTNFDYEAFFKKVESEIFKAIATEIKTSESNKYVKCKNSLILRQRHIRFKNGFE